MKWVKIKYYCMMILFMVLATACQAVKEKNSSSTKETTSQSANITDQNKMAGVITKQYKKDGIVAEYPVLESGGSEEELKAWNQIIEKDFNKILDLYSFNPFPELTPIPNDQIPTILQIKYEMKLNNDDFLSILYTAAYNSPFSAHPTDLVYTTNINKRNNERMKLSDIVLLNKDFVKDFRTWDYIPVEVGNDELNQAIQNYVANMSNKDILMGFQSADIIGSGNLWGIYSYLTPSVLGISLGVPNYIGDHVEFVREYSKLSKFMK